MYHYDHYRYEDAEHLVRAMRTFPLAIITSCVNGEFLATHLPLLVEPPSAGSGWSLLGHLDGNNPQAAILDGQQVYVIFAGPNRYISARVYATKQLPTFNYLAVHAVGRCRIEAPGLAILDDIERLVAMIEGPPRPWAPDRQDPRVRSMAMDIRRVRIAVERIEGRFKLSQEKVPADYFGAATHLLSPDMAGVRRLLEGILGPIPREKAMAGADGGNEIHA